jgi:hypothetical protein
MFLSYAAASVPGLDAFRIPIEPLQFSPWDLEGRA